MCQKRKSCIKLRTAKGSNSADVSPSEKHDRRCPRQEHIKNIDSRHKVRDILSLGCPWKPRESFDAKYTITITTGMPKEKPWTPRKTKWPWLCNRSSNQICVYNARRDETENMSTRVTHSNPMPKYDSIMYRLTIRALWPLSRTASIVHFLLSPSHHKYPMHLWSNQRQILESESKEKEQGFTDPITSFLHPPGTCDHQLYI